MLEKKVLDIDNSEKIQKIVGYVNEILNVVDQFEPSRQGSIALTKLEEAVMWTQSMMANIPLKQEVVNPLETKNEEINNPV